MKLAFVSPMPPARSGVADYSAGLLRALRQSAQVDVVEQPTPGYDNAIYQLGNNPLHLAAYRAALAAPGIAVLHDAVLHHLLLGALGERAYTEEFVYNYGEWARDLAGELWRSRSRSSADARYFQYPMLRRVVERSRAVVVHNPAAARMVRQAAAGVEAGNAAKERPAPMPAAGTATPDAAAPAAAAGPAPHVVEIPHYFVPPHLAGDGRRTRDRLGLSSRDVVVSVFGYLRDSKRIPSVMKALPAARQARLLLVGEFVSSELERALAPQLEEAQAIRVGHVPEPEFWRLAEITDICVNLRSPGAGETSGIAIKMMGIGKPVLVTAGEETARFPDLSVIRIDPGEAEVEMLAHYLHALAESDEMRREIGRRAALCIAEHHTLERAAKMYLDLAA